MTSSRPQIKLPITAAVITLVGTMMGQLSSSLPSPQSSCASHTHDSNTQRLFCNTCTDTSAVSWFDRQKRTHASRSLSKYLAVEVPRLAEKAVLLVRPVGASVLVVAAVRPRITGSVPRTRELVFLTRGAVQLISTIWAVPVTVTTLLFRVTAPVPSTRNLPGEAEPVHLNNTEPQKTLIRTELKRTDLNMCTSSDAPHLVRDVKAAGSIDLVGVEVDPELTRR